MEINDEIIRGIRENGAQNERLKALEIRQDAHEKRIADFIKRLETESKEKKKNWLAIVAIIISLAGLAVNVGERIYNSVMIATKNKP